jgi:hypothetical protein
VSVSTSASCLASALEQHGFHGGLVEQQNALGPDVRQPASFCFSAKPADGNAQAPSHRACGQQS